MERNANGTFAKGNKGGPGRPKRSREERYLARLSKRCTLKQWEKIVDTAIARAKAGDARARQWLSDYLLGKPAQEVKVEAVTDLIVNLGWGDDDFDDNPSEASQGPAGGSE